MASYLTVVIAATGLVMLPVHLASYRERGVLRRFAAAGFPRWSFAIAQLIVGLLTTAVACALLLAVAAPVYGIPAVHDAWRVAVALPLGAVAFVSIGGKSEAQIDLNELKDDEGDVEVPRAREGRGC